MADSLVLLMRRLQMAWSQPHGGLTPCIGTVCAAADGQEPHGGLYGYRYICHINETYASKTPTKTEMELGMLEKNKYSKKSSIDLF